MPQIKLIDEGNTIPFVHDIEKEATGTWMTNSCEGFMRD